MRVWVVVVVSRVRIVDSARRIEEPIGDVK